MKTLFYLSTIVLLLNSCDPAVYKEIYRNNTDYTLHFYIADSPEIEFLYPDTIIAVNEVKFGEPSASIRSGSYVNVGGFGKVEEIFKYLPKDTLSVYFFHPDTLAKYPWETIRKEYNILKRSDLSIEDMQLLDYEIAYPPTEMMKDIKMYPPYGE